jgi:alpha-glucosidase
MLQIVRTFMLSSARVALAFVCLSVSAVHAATSTASISSPSGVLKVELSINAEGRPDYRVSRAGEIVIAPSRLGFLLADAPKLERNFEIESHSIRSGDETWEQPWGERRFVRDRFTELRVRLKEKTAPHRALEVVFRLYDDGLGFRYEFPKQATLRRVNIVDELTEFDVATAATAWWIPAGEWNRYEYLYRTTPLREVGQAHTPITLRTRDGLHLSFHEAALVDYSSMWLRRVDGQRLKATLSPAGTGARVTREAPFVTPWRTIQIVDSAAALVNGSDLILNLNEPNRLGDVSWVKPMKYVGIWWGMHLGTQSWSSGATHGATTANTRRLIDFAAKHGFGGVLVEGWNQGWDADWFGNGESFSFTQSYSDFDIEHLAAYAKKKGVEIIGHHETSGHVAHYESQLGDALDFYERLGIHSIKTGYVADAAGIKVKSKDGSLVFEWHDGQAMSRHHLKVVTEAAKRRISINAHEPIKDTGLRRTYPNWIAREGARGMEYNAWGDPPNPPEHEAILTFTRMLSGPMDFTPGVLSLEGKAGQRIQSTLAKQLALYVVIYSPLQMAADLPENYQRHAKAFQFIKDVPCDWSESRALSGEIGDFAVIARKDRKSDAWYLGAVTDETSRTVTTKFDFLDAERRYRLQMYRDGEGADWKGNPHALDIEVREVTREDTVSVVLAAGGGAAMRIVPLD